MADPEWLNAERGAKLHETYAEAQAAYIEECAYWKDLGQLTKWKEIKMRLKHLDRKPVGGWVK